MKEAIREAFAEYRKSCYGNATLSITQVREVRQAFLSGIHWLNTAGDVDREELLKALRELLNIPGRG